MGGVSNIKEPDCDDYCERNDDIGQLILLSKSVSPSIIPSPITTDFLQSITKLDLFQADLSSLPSTLPEHLPNLSILFCMRNKFQEVPAVIGKCPKLQMVSFKSNQIKSIHPEAMQEQMRWLILTDNQITALPSTIGRCVKLQKFMLSGNLIETLPEEISNCHNLELIRLASNKLKDPPLHLLQLPNLSWAAFSDNPFLKEMTSSDTENGDKMSLKVFQDDNLDNASAGTELGKGASGITRKYTLSEDLGGEVGNGTEVAVKEYYSSITSDGNPQEEKMVSMVASSLGCESLVKVLGKTPNGSLIMELLRDYAVLANPPSLESCSRDVYDDDMTVSDERALAVVGQLLYALMKLHENGICHGDFYGHNILISTVDEQKAWLTDFGAAFFYDTDATYGQLIQKVERRAFGHLVNEIANLVSTSNGDLCDKLREISSMCKDMTFKELSNKWEDVMKPNVSGYGGCR